VEIWVTPLDLGTYELEVMEPVEPEPIMPWQYIAIGAHRIDSTEQDFKVNHGGTEGTEEVDFSLGESVSL
jgi:hypothetical protein